MFRLLCSQCILVLVVILPICLSALGKYPIGKLREGKDKENEEDKEKKGNEKEPDDYYVRYLVEYGVKNPLFGSSLYDPVKQVFVAGKTKHGSGKKTKDGISTVMNDKGDQTTTTEPGDAKPEEPSTPNRKRFGNSGVLPKSRTVKVPRKLVSQVTFTNRWSLDKKSQGTVKTTVKKVVTTPEEGWWARQHSRRKNEKDSGDFNNLQR